MKKTILTLTLIGCSVLAFSQAKLEIGLKAGANFSNTSFDFTGVSTESITSFHGGAFALIKATKIGIQPEILFSKQGSDVNLLGTADEFDFSYVNIPVMIKLYLVAGLNLQAGPQFGILTNAVDVDGADISETLKNSDLSAAFGAGWDAPFGLKIDARYVLGLNDINDDATITTELKNRNFQVSVGYTLFKLGK